MHAYVHMHAVHLHIGIPYYMYHVKDMIKMYVCMYVWMYGCMDVWMDVCMRGCMYACMYVCMYVCMHGMAWHDMAWYGMAWYGMVLYCKKKCYNVYTCMYDLLCNFIQTLCFVCIYIHTCTYAYAHCTFTYRHTIRIM